MTPSSLAIVRRVLVDGEKQIDVTKSLHPPKTKQHVNLLVNVFWDHYLRSLPLPAGWKRDTVTLPKKDWELVRELEANALRALADASRKRHKAASDQSVPPPVKRIRGPIALGPKNLSTVSVDK